jgi:restriction endonuclease S subunit
MRNVEDEAIDWASLTRVTLPSSRRPDYLSAGDVIFTTRGRRNTAVALRDVRGQAVCSPHFFVLRINEPNSLIPEFLAWQINQKPAQEYFQQAATGSYILNITRAAIEALVVTIPPIALQCRIVALAEAAQHERHLLNALVDNRQRELDALANQILTPGRFSAA